MPLRAAVVYGGVPLDPQIKELRAGVEILVATPGRLLDLVGQRAANLGQVEILVLDEADRMLDMGFMPDIRRILDLLTSRKQTLLFSATFSDDIKRLAGSILHDPVTIEINRHGTAAETVRQLVYPVDRERKEELLRYLVIEGDWHQVLVFTRTKLAASRLASWLDRHGVASTAIHSDRAQSDRTKALEAFKAGEIRVLVATDVAARGLDIEDLPHVVNFELPWNPEDYVHRIGRTGRAGATGDAISLVCIDEADLLRGVQRLLQRAIPWEVAEGFEPSPGQNARPLRAPRGAAGPRRRAAGRSSGAGPTTRGGRRPPLARPSAQGYGRRGRPGRGFAGSGGRITLSRAVGDPRRVRDALVGEHRDRDALAGQVAGDVADPQVPPRVAQRVAARDRHRLDAQPVRDPRVELAGHAPCRRAPAPRATVTAARRRPTRASSGPCRAPSRRSSPRRRRR